MIDIIKSNMSSYDFTDFKRDYDRLISVKNTNLWSKALSFILPSRKAPYFKDYFNMLTDKYNYRDYKYYVLEDYNINDLLNSIDNSEIVEALELFYVTDTYIGNIVEELLFDELIEANIDVQRSFYLDNDRKVDLLINNRDFQIKNISFLNSKKAVEHINDYRRINPNLYFIFYYPKAEDIYITTINKYPFTLVNNLYDLVNFKKIDCLSLKEYIQKHTNK